MSDRAVSWTLWQPVLAAHLHLLFPLGSRKPLCDCRDSRFGRFYTITLLSRCSSARVNKQQSYSMNGFHLVSNVMSSEEIQQEMVTLFLQVVAQKVSERLAEWAVLVVEWQCLLLPRKCWFFNVCLQRVLVYLWKKVLRSLWCIQKEQNLMKFGYLSLVLFTYLRLAVWGVVVLSTTRYLCLICLRSITVWLVASYLFPLTMKSCFELN